MAETPHELVGTVVDGRYRVDAFLSGGGMGEVYRAEQVSLGRRVALKVLRSNLAPLPEMTQRFTDEAQILSRIDHPNIVRVIDFAAGEARSYLVMEFVEGPTLHQALAERGHFDPARAVALLVQLCDALTAAHGAGIIHRDLKPENVILTGPQADVPKILDFGIARLAERPGSTQEGMVIGTPEYLSPEQALGRKLDARSDLYSLCVVAYRMLAGKLPFDAPEVRDLLLMHVSAEPPPLQEASPALLAVPALCAAVMRGLAKNPDERYASAAELKAALKDGLEGKGAGATALLRTTVPPGSTASRMAVVSAKTQNLAIMFTDIKGFTERTSRQTREQNARMLAIHDALLLPVVKGFRGRKVKSIGDALLVTFQSPTDSVLCGTAIQDRLWTFNRTAPVEDRIEVRVAIGLGEVRVEAGDVYGEPVNIASRVEGLAEAGEVLFTDAVYLAMNKSEVPAEEAGTHALKGIPDPVRVFRVRRSSDTSQWPYGGRALSTLGGLPDALAAGDAALRDRRGELLSALSKGRTALKKWAPRVVGGALALSLLAGGGWALWIRTHDPLHRAASLIDDKQFTAALAELEQVKEKERQGKAHLLKGKALHGQQKLEAGFVEFAAAVQRDAALAKDDDLLRALVDDLDAETFGGNRAALVALLGKSVGTRAEDPLRTLVQSPRGRVRRNALEALEQMGRAKDDDRFAVANADLADKGSDCEVRTAAVRRLATIGDERATKLLRDASNDRRCGNAAREAQDAVRRIDRARNEH